MTEPTRLELAEENIAALRAYLTALLFISRSLATALSLSRPDALAVLTTATDCCNQHMEENHWSADMQTQARTTIDWLGRALLENARAADHP